MPYSLFPSSFLPNHKLGTVILCPTLSNGHNDGLMVPRRDHGAHTIHAWGEAARDLGVERAVLVDWLIDALEIGKAGRVWRLESAQTANLLDRDVRVADDVAVLVQILGRGVVADAGVDEVASTKVARLDGDVEGLVRRHNIARLRVGDDGRNHVVDGGDPAHRDAVARPSPVLLTIGKSVADAEVDEVGSVAVMDVRNVLILPNIKIQW